MTHNSLCDPNQQSWNEGSATDPDPDTDTDTDPDPDPDPDTDTDTYPYPYPALDPAPYPDPDLYSTSNIWNPRQRKWSNIKKKEPGMTQKYEQE